MPPAKPQRSWVSLRFSTRLTNFIDLHELGIVLESSAGYQFEEAPDTVLVPDVSFIGRDRITSSTSWKEYFRIRPQLVFEARSPSERKYQIERKVRIYLDNGVRLVIYADPLKRQLTL